MDVNAERSNDDLVLEKVLDLLLLGDGKKSSNSYFVRSSIDSYNCMIDNIKSILSQDIYITLDEANPDSPSVLFIPKGIRIIHPKIEDKLVTVSTALFYKMSYYASIEVNYEQVLIKSNSTKISMDTDWVEVVKLPIMVGSSICVSLPDGILIDPLYSREDPGGYFILKGNKKVIFLKPRIKFNEVLIFPNGKTPIDTGTTSISISDISCQVISKHAYSYPSFQHYLIIEYMNGIFKLNLSTTTSDQSFNVFSVIKRMSNMRDADIIRYYLDDVYLCNSQEEVFSLITVTLQDSIKLSLDDKNLDIIRYSIAHLDTDEEKTSFLLYCIKKLLRVSLRYELVDVRDSYNRTKLIDSPGSLTEELFISYFKITKKMMRDKINNSSLISNINFLSELKIFQTEYMLKFFISNDFWGTSKKRGVCALIQPINYLHQLECLRKISEDEKDTNIIIEKRRAHTDYQGFICSSTTPMSRNVGLHKHLAFTCFVNPYKYSDHHLLKEALQKYISKSSLVKGNYDVFVDGFPLGSYDISSIKKLESYIDDLKFKHNHSKYIVSYIDYTRLSMCVNSHGGRLLVPVIKLKDNHVPVTIGEIRDCATLEEFTNKFPGVFDYVDTHWIDHNPISISFQDIITYNEELKINYGAKASYKYMAVHLTPYAQYSISISLNPFACNQASIRNTHSAKHLVSSITCNPSIEYLSMDKTKKHLIRGSTPLTLTPNDKYLKTIEMPIVINMFVEMCSDIKNQEDSSVMNWNAVARGLIAINEFKTYEMYISFKSDEKFVTPTLKSRYFGYNFSKLGPDGIIKFDSKVVYGDVLLCKIENTNEDSSSPMPKVEFYDQYTPGRVCLIDRYKNNQEAREYVIVKICKTNMGDSADKLCVDGETEVFTLSGWQSISKSRGLSIACLGIDNTLTFEVPSSFHEYEIDEKVYHIESDYVDLLTTLNHKMLVSTDGVSYKLQRSIEILGKNVTYKHSVQTCDLFVRNPYVMFNGVNISTINLLTFQLSIYLSCIVTTSEVLFTSVTPNLISILSTLKIKYRVFNYVIILEDINIKRYIISSLYSFPSWVWYCPVSELNLFMNVLCSRKIYSLFDDIQKYAILNGFILTPDMKLVIDDYMYLPNKKERLINYKGKVYCPTVSSGVFLVRRNNKVCFTGNSTDQGQKGVIGQIVSASEFGHTDLNFICSVKCSASAHTRMTGGQLIVPLTNYYSILKGVSHVHNAFDQFNINGMRDYLESNGMQRDQLCRMYREDTQLLMLNSVNVVPLSYRRLKQLADDGNVKKADSGNDPITRNPIKGKNGSVRIGRMEMDALEVHGVSEYLHSLINYNDRYYICNKCGIKVDTNENKDVSCKICGNASNIIRTKIPAALSAVIDYCLPLGVQIKMNVSDDSVII